MPQAKFQVLSVGKRNCYSPEMAGETFLQVLQICKGKAPGRKKHKGLASLCKFLAVVSGWDKTQRGQATGVFQWPMEVKF